VRAARPIERREQSEDAVDDNNDSGDIDYGNAFNNNNNIPTNPGKH
jgi:hypothetical protein